MRQVSLAAVTLAALALAGAAYADSNYGARTKGDQCWHGQSGMGLGYWGNCARTAQEGPSAFNQSNAKAKAKTANTSKR